MCILYALPVADIDDLTKHYLIIIVYQSGM